MKKSVPSLKVSDHRFLLIISSQEDQIKSVAKYWVEALTNVTPPDVTIYGKLELVKQPLPNLLRNSGSGFQRKNVNVRVEYIRCTDFTTEYQVIARLCQQMGQDVFTVAGLRLK